MNTIAERLTWALEKSDLRSIRSLHREIEERGLHTVTYSTVHRYFSGEVEEPPLSFLRAADQVLGVPAEWLTFGRRPTDGRGLKRHVGSNRPAESPAQGAIRVSSSSVAGSTVQAYCAGEDVMLAIVEALVRAQPDDAPELTEKDVADLALRLSFAVSGILGAVRRDAPGPVIAGATLGVLAAVLGYVPAKGEGRPLKDVVRILPTPPKAKGIYGHA